MTNYHITKDGKIGVCKAKNSDTCKLDFVSEEFVKSQRKARYVHNKAVEGISGSGARQGHGIVFEKRMCEKFNLNQTIGDPTNKFDAHTQLGIPVSIKLGKKGPGMGFGDIFRQSLVDENFFIISGEWTNDRLNPEAISFYWINDTDFWRSNFDLELLNDYKELLSFITNECEDDELWKSSIKNLKTKWINKFGENAVFIPAPKRDHGKQKRIQVVCNRERLINFKISEMEFKDLLEKEAV